MKENVNRNDRILLPFIASFVVLFSSKKDKSLF